MFLEKLVLEQDCVFCLTIIAPRSPTNEHVDKVRFAIRKNYRQVREQAAIPGPFMMRVAEIPAASLPEPHRRSTRQAA